MAGRKRAPSHAIPAVALAFSVIITIAILATNPAESMRHILGDWGYLGIFAIMMFSNATIIIPAPGLFAVFAAGGAYDPLLIGIAGGLGAALGEMTGYLFGYGSAGMMDADRFRAYRKVREWMQRHGIVTITLLAAMPNPFFDIAGISAGMLKYKWWKFLLACAAGTIFKSILLAYIGHSLLWQ